LKHLGGSIIATTDNRSLTPANTSLPLTTTPKMSGEKPYEQ